MDKLAVNFADIEAARALIKGQVLRTPMLPAPRLSGLTGASVFVKYENLQVTNSFKDRGALVKLSSLNAQERVRGVIAMSAGNHAQAVAYHASRLKIAATIVMPVTARMSSLSEKASAKRKSGSSNSSARRALRRCTLTTILSSSPGRAPSHLKCWKTRPISIASLFPSAAEG